MIVAKMYVRSVEGDPRSMTVPTVDPLKAVAQQCDALGEKNYRSKLLPRRKIGMSDPVIHRNFRPFIEDKTIDG